jgi:hypothetical protein
VTENEKFIHRADLAKYWAEVFKNMNKKHINRLRELARQVKEIAELPIQQTNIKLWQGVNDLNSTRPVVHTRDYPIYLIEYGDELTPTIEDETLQRFEMDLLLRIYEWNHLKCDRVIEPIIKCQCILNDTMFGIKETSSSASDNFTFGKEIRGSKHFISQIKTEEDLALIKAPVVTFDEEATMEKYKEMKEIFDGILEVKLHGSAYFHCVPWDDLMTWMGLSEGLYNFVLMPAMLHKAVRIYINAQITRAKQYESLGILSSNNCAANIGNNGFGFTTKLPPPTKNGIGAKLKDIWGENADQILTTVSPGMSKEFAFAYEREWADLFGMYSYGCCEKLDHKITELTSSFTNLRKISVSPFSKLEEAMEKIGSKYTVCFKPNSTYLVGNTWDKEPLRKELVTVCELAKKYRSHVEINMKTILTLNGDPRRLWEWCDMAREIVSHYYV